MDKNKIKLLNPILFLAVIISCKQEYVKESTKLPSIKKAKVTQLKPSQDPLPIYASGKLKALENIKLSFKIGGFIKTLNVQEGQFVKKGQLLSRLDLSEINAQVSQASANVEKLKRDLARFKRLLADSAATLQNVQDLETGLEVAEAQLEKGE